MSGAGRWWVAAADRAWGPYPAERLPAFRDEGRLGPDSLVGRDPAGPFARAAGTPELSGLFATATDTAPADAEAAATPDTSPDAPAGRTLLVVAHGPEAELSALEAALPEHGEAVRLRPGLWLVRARERAAPLRNALSRGLGGGGALLVVEAPLAAAAWFNLDGDTDRALRRLWAG